VDLASAEAVITPAAGKSFDPARIAKAVKDAGFTPGPIEVTAVGTLVEKDGLLVLEMAGPLAQFVLADGAREEDLKQRHDLRGQRLRVTGKLHPSHADQPPGLTVERFEPLAHKRAPKRSGPGQRLSVEGRLTDEGVECQALRGTDGTLYTLVPWGEKARAYKTGDRVSVTGRVAEASTCMQGITLVVEGVKRCP
jgi:hypothetical protein